MAVSVRVALTQKSRPYKIEIYGLQDDFIGTLQSYNDSFIGQVVEPVIDIKDDGSQSFTCSIPKFYINPETNLKTENPRWSDIKNGVLAQNTRVLKVFMQTENETKVYAFIIDKITDKRDSHFSVYKEIEANGLAFAELGKQGYKLELNSHTLETDYEKDNNTVATIDYWLDKVFPNERDNSGKIIKWLTPWSYEISMDWSHYSAKNRLSSKIYEDPYISSWTLDEGNGNTEPRLEPGSREEGKEKARYIDCKHSNKYNITQTLAETFGVFCVYEYKCDERGRFLHNYTVNGQVWTGRKVIFYNRAIKANYPFYIDYQKNLTSISRTSDSSEVYSKLYVTPIQSAATETGYVSIADTPVNPLLDDFILNFDYLYNTGSISDYQRNFIKTYEVATYKINSELVNISPDIEHLTVEINDAEAEIKVIENEIKSAEESLVEYQGLQNNPLIADSVTKNKDNAYSVIFTQDGDCYSAKLRLEGVDVGSIEGYEDFKYDPYKKIFPSTTHPLIATYSKRHLADSDNNFYILLNDYGYPCEIYASLGNTSIKSGKTLVYLSLTYSPKSAYETICSQLRSAIANKTRIKSDKTQNLDTLKSRLEEIESKYDGFIEQKNYWNNKLELVLGPALREGYWTPDSYEDPGEKVEKDLLGSFQENYTAVGAKRIFDNKYFASEEKGYYYDTAYEVNNQKRYYDYILLDNSTLAAWRDKNLEELVLHLTHPNKQGDLLPERLLYENAGFIFAFIKRSGDTDIRPALLLNNTSVAYDDYDMITYSFQGEALSNVALERKSGSYTLYYPRIAVFDNHVNYFSDNLKITSYRGTNYKEQEAKLLKKYEDYHVLTRQGKPYFTLKITDVNTLDDILNGNYHISYQLSRANEMLYLDAKEVARDNSQPRYSYELTVSNIPEEIKFVDLGQLVYINDHSLGIHAASGYISGVKYALDKPQDDELTIQNYKTKFEDLFSTITASSEAMKNNSVAYNIAAGAFTPGGQIEGSVLQNSINNNNVSFNYSNTNVVIDPDQGIILTNTSPYMNGVYGQVALRGGGIFLSDAIDAAGGRIWSTGITPSGINASMITAGQLDTETIRIFSGSNLAFQWNAEGIFAYQRNKDGIPDMNAYVKYSDKGLQYIRGNNTEVDLGWNGLLISTQGGSTELTGDKGLVVYYGEKNDAGNNYAVRIGHFNQRKEDGSYEDGSYGLRLYNKVEKDGTFDYVPTLISSEKGELWLKDTLRIGTEKYNDGGIETENPGIVGITGAGEVKVNEITGELEYPIRFWAGDSRMDVAPFWVREDGSFSATKGAIGGWILGKDTLTSKDGNTTLSSEGDERINVNDNFIVNKDGSIIAKQAEIHGAIYAESGKIGGFTVEEIIDSAIGDPDKLTIVLSSSQGTVATTDDYYITRLNVTIYKGNTEFTEEEYAQYKYYWEYSTEDAPDSWYNLMTADDENIVENDYTLEPYYDCVNLLSSSIYIRCRLEGGESA